MSDQGSRRHSIDGTIRQALDLYFETLGNQKPHALHDMVMTAAERPLLDHVMTRYRGNVSHAAAALGMTRNTLRKKLALHGLEAKAKGAEGFKL